MVFSQGQNFYNSLLDYSRNNTQNDNEAIEQTFNLQLRLSDFYKNNSFQTLNNSKLYSGEKTYLGEQSPLGGPLNMYVSGTTNLPGSGLMAPEFPFWSQNFDLPNAINPNIEKTDLSKDNGEKLLPVKEQPQLVEQFKNLTGKKENLGKNESFVLLSIVSVIVLAILIFIIIYVLKKVKNKFGHRINAFGVI